jgi:hypothetical protein
MTALLSAARLPHSAMLYIPCMGQRGRQPPGNRRPERACWAAALAGGAWQPTTSSASRAGGTVSAWLVAAGEAAAAGEVAAPHEAEEEEGPCPAALQPSPSLTTGISSCR